MQQAPTDSRAVCTALDQFRIPAAVVDVGHDRLMTWNRSFVNVLALSPAELQEFRPSQTLQPLPLAKDVSTPSSHTPFQLNHPAVPAGTTGRAFRKDRETALVILDTFAVDRNTDDFVRGILVGQQTTHDHLKQTFHDTVSQQVMAATFAVEMLRGKLEGGAVAKSEGVAAISMLLQSLFTDIQSALNRPPAYPPSERPPEN